MTTKLFRFTTRAFNDDALVSMPGFEFRGQPFKLNVHWYPFEEWMVVAHIRAKNRREASKQIERAAVYCRDLSDGQKWGAA